MPKAGGWDQTHLQRRALELQRAEASCVLCLVRDTFLGRFPGASRRWPRWGRRPRRSPSLTSPPPSSPSEALLLARRGRALPPERLPQRQLRRSRSTSLRPRAGIPLRPAPFQRAEGGQGARPTPLRRGARSQPGLHGRRGLRRPPGRLAQAASASTSPKTGAVRAGRWAGRPRRASACRRRAGTAPRTGETGRGGARRPARAAWRPRGPAKAPMGSAGRR